MVNKIVQVDLIHVLCHVIVQNPKLLIEFHGFLDASEKAYGCCIYLHSIDTNNKIEIHLLHTKSRVSSLKSISLPRLELLGSVLLKLMKKFIDALELDINGIFL